jgi:hypothetical protein
MGTALVGCRPRGIESFVSATTPQRNTGEYKGDEYSSGGIADANGGRIVRTAKGAKTGAAAKMNTAQDTPAKGSGQRAGENPGLSSLNGPLGQGNTSAVDGRIKN